MPRTILIAEDDEKTASLVALYLEREGFRPIVAHNGKQALELADIHEPALVILDLMLPELDGWEVCRHLRKSSDVPILMLTPRGDEIDRISGLTLGADDYVVKPFSPRELMARVKAILRRSIFQETGKRNVLSCEGVEVDLETHKVSVNGVRVFLTPLEFKLLAILIKRPGRVFTREELLSKLYQEDDVSVVDRVVDVHIGKIRQKIESMPSNPRYIITVRGVGYQFTEGGAQ
jgi:DNA-binding response OmpR family regulator